MTSETSTDKSPKRIAAMFDAVAPKYDFLNHLLSAGIDHLWRRRTVREGLRRSRGTRPFLDVAAGTADLTIALARALKKRDRRERLQPESAVRVEGIDFSSEMIRFGREKIARRGLSDAVRLRQGDALALPYEAEMFDAVTVAFGIRNMADTDKAVAEMVRVCAPDGTIAILEFSMPALPVLRNLYRFYFKTVLPKVGRLFSRRSGSSYAYLPASVLRFDTPDRMKARMAEAGLTEITSIPLTFGIAFLYLARKPN